MHLSNNSLLGVTFVQLTCICFLLEGNQYTYEGNEYFSKNTREEAVKDAVNNAIGNQEIGKSPIEYTNQLSRAKIFDMKSIRVPDQVRSYNNLYQE